MIEVRLTAFARGRLWGPSELPHGMGESVADRVVMADTKATAQGKSLAVEVAIPRGPVLSYGLLGGTYEPAPVGLLKMSVLNGGRGEFDQSLAGLQEVVIFGMPSEYVDSIVSGFFTALNRFPETPGGTFKFDRSAYGHIGSSRQLFRELAVCVTRLAFGDPTPWDEVLRQELKLR